MLLVPLFCFVTALAFASFGIAVAGTVNKIDQFSYVTTLFVTPLFLVAGTFFPIDQLPEGLQVAANFNPLYQLVELVRHASFGFEATDPLRLAALIALAVALWRLAVRADDRAADRLATASRRELPRRGSDSLDPRRESSPPSASPRRGTIRRWHAPARGPAPSSVCGGLPARRPRARLGHGPERRVAATTPRPARASPA